MYRSQDGGRSFTLINGELLAQDWVRGRESGPGAFAEIDGTLFLSGLGNVFTSRDGGDNWRRSVLRPIVCDALSTATNCMRRFSGDLFTRDDLSGNPMLRMPQV